MKRYLKLWVLISVLVFIACEKNDDSTLKPTIITGEVKYVTQYTAICGGKLTSGGESDGIVYGVCWSTNPHPTIEDKISDANFIDSLTSPVDFTCPVKGLTGSTTYYVRAFAQNVQKFTNGVGSYPVGETAYGNEYSFTTDAATPTVTDVDGNVYHTIQIGTQLWMLENLNTTKYNDGTDIPTVKGDIGETFNSLSPHYFYYWYNPSNAWYNPLNKNTIGLLYNGYAVATGKLAPTGWHVPTLDDWKKLSDYLGGDDVSGAKLKSALTSTLANHVSFLYEGNWMSPNNGTTNSSGFSALPGGYYSNNDTIYYHVDNPNTYGFESNGYLGCWWSSTEDVSSQNSLNSVYLSYLHTNTYFYINDKRLGFSVRCVRD